MEGYNSKLAMAIGGGLALGLAYLIFRNRGAPQIENIDDFEDKKNKAKSTTSTDTPTNNNNNAPAVAPVIEDVSQLKQKGNDMFKAKKFSEAIHLYSQAIELCTDENDKKVLFSNRAACYISLDKPEYFQKALEDCEEGLRIAPTWSRLLVRSGKAAHYLKDYEESYVRLNLGKKHEPTLKDDAVTKLLEEASKYIPAQSDMDTRVNIERKFFESRLFRDIDDICLKTFGITHSALCEQLKKTPGLQKFTMTSKPQDILDFLASDSKFSTAASKDRDLFTIACWWGALANRDDDNLQCLRSLSLIIQDIKTDQPSLKLLIAHCMMRSVPVLSDTAHWKRIFELTRDAIAQKPNDALISQTFCSILLRNQMPDPNQKVEEIQHILEDLYQAMKNPEAMYHLLAETGLRMWFKLFTLPEMQQKLSQEDEKNRKANLSDTEQFIQGVVHGTFKKVIRNDFLMDSLTKFPFSNPAIEGVLSPFRKVLIGLEDLTHFKDVLPIMSAIATQVYLTGYFWVAESSELHDFDKKLFKLKGILKKGQALSDAGVPTEEFVFYLASVALYKPLDSDLFFEIGEGEDSFRSVLRRMDLSKLDPFFTHMIDRTALSRVDQEQFITQFKTLGLVNDKLLPVDEKSGDWFMIPGAVTQFSLEEYMKYLLPKPIFFQSSPPVEVLIAGCRSGKEAAFFFTSIKGIHITVIDRSKTLLAKTKRLLQNVGISSNISFYVADLATVKLSDFPHPPKRGFDLITCVETLNHEQDPLKAMDNLSQLLRSGGIFKGSVYTPKSFRFITKMRSEFYRTNHQFFQQGKENSLEVKPDVPIKPEDIIQMKQSIDPTNAKDMMLTAQIISCPSIYNLHEFHRLFLHPHLFDIDLTTLKKTCSTCGLGIMGFEFPGIPHKSYLDYLVFTDRQDPDLTNPDSINQFESKSPDAFAPPTEIFRVFWAQKN